MIIVRTPLRVSLFGGGTDLPIFYRKLEGNVISFAFNKYIYISINRILDTNDIALRYSKTERVRDVKDIQHPIFRSALSRFRISGVEISVNSDIPSGTGLGSSSAFTVGLVKTLSEYMGTTLTSDELAEIACEIELKDLGEPIGKQDQYAASFGGINNFIFLKNEQVLRRPINATELLEEYISNSSLLVRVGGVRNASSILKEQNSKLESGFNWQVLSKIRAASEDFCSRLPESLSEIGSLLNEYWHLKKSLALEISNQEVEEELEYAKKLGASGGKLLGAGKSGFLFLVFPDHTSRNLYVEIKSKISTVVLPKIDYYGSKVIYRSE